MPFRAALLTALSCLVLAAPAAASERSEARRYAAAVAPRIVLAPEEREAIVASYEARSASVAATCLDAITAAQAREETGMLLFMLFGAHASADAYAVQIAWMEAGDARLARIRTRSPVLRKARAARRQLTAYVRGGAERGSRDFCAMVTAWQATGFTGLPPDAEELLDAADAVPDAPFRRAERLFKRAGVARPRREAFGGEARWPVLRAAALGRVEEAFGVGRAVVHP